MVELKNISSYKDLLNTVSSLPVSDLPGHVKEQLADFLWDVTIKAARENFYIFVQVMAPVLIPGFKTGRHIEIICNELQKLYDAIQRNDKTESKLQVFLPPESMKTVLCSHLFPAWCLGKDPTWRIIAVAHSTPHAEKELGANCKRIVQLAEYEYIFPKTKISRDSPGAGFWKTTKHGYYFAGGHAKQYPGKRANLLLTDDVVSEQTVPSEIQTINTNYSSGLESRLLEDNSGQLVVNTRWYIDDISGFLEGRDGGIDVGTGELTGGDSDRPWRIVRVPALLDEAGYKLLHRDSDPKDKYILGGSYWPEHKSLANLLDAKRRCTPHQWSALYLQNPIPEEGSVFKKDKFKNWFPKDPPEVSNVIISLDTAFSERETKDAAESVYEIWGIFPMKETDTQGRESVQGNMILLGYDKGYWSYPELKERCKSLYQEYGAILDFFLIEDRASGISLIQDLQASGIPVVPFQPEKDKVSRAHAANAMVHSGRVYLNPNMIFTQEFMAEVLKFPAGGKDTTDAFTQAVLWMRNNWQILGSDYTAYEEQFNDDKVVSFKRPRSYWASTKR